jgi:hypothetical protein
MNTKFYSENVKGKDNLIELCLDMRLTLMRIEGNRMSTGPCRLGTSVNSVMNLRVP